MATHRAPPEAGPGRILPQVTGHPDALRAALRATPPRAARAASAQADATRLRHCRAGRKQRQPGMSGTESHPVPFLRWHK